MLTNTKMNISATTISFAIIAHFFNITYNSREIVTVTFNPSIDYIVSVDNFRLGRTNRTCAERMLPGGKGINVSIVLGNMGIKSTALSVSLGVIIAGIIMAVISTGVFSFIGL